MEKKEPEFGAQDLNTGMGSGIFWSFIRFSGFLLSAVLFGQRGASDNTLITHLTHGIMNAKSDLFCIE